MVRLSAIRGPGMCGMDFPLKVSAFDEAVPVAFADDPRPPGAIPSGLPNWPVVKSRACAPAARCASAFTRALPPPVRKRRPADIARTRRRAGGSSPENYDYRAPYGEGAATSMAR